jgi:predicted transcriptional regulator
MTKLLDKAISKLRALPTEKQDALAEVILNFADENHYTLTTAQIAEVTAAIEEADRGEFVTESELAALWKKFGPENRLD